MAIKISKLLFFHVHWLTIYTEIGGEICVQNPLQISKKDTHLTKNSLQLPGQISETSNQTWRN